jgi:Flp pilus assembly protein TadG
MRLREEKGQSLVEFALLIPLLILILMAIIEFGFMFNAYITISNASREGARLGSLGGSDFAVQERVADTTEHLNQSNMSVTVSPSSRSRGDMITVDVIYDYQLITPVISAILNPLIDLQVTTKMRVE